MPYVIRNAEGAIQSIHNTQPEGGHAEELPPGHPELIAFAAGEQDGQLSSLDLGMIRVIDDLVNLLVEKRVFLYTELPEAAQRKLNQRVSLRQSGHNLIEPDDAEHHLF